MKPLVQADSAVCDLVADDSSGMQKQKTVYIKLNNGERATASGKRSKKYIKLNNGERVTASGKIKNESGAKSKGGKTGLYKKWMAKSHSKISLTGAGLDGDDEANMAGDRGMQGNHRTFKGGNKRSFKGGRNQRSMPNASVPFEIRDPEQIRKQRQQKVTRTMMMKNNPKKGKFGKKRTGGKGGGKGGSKGGGKGGNKGGKGKGGREGKMTKGRH